VIEAANAVWWRIPQGGPSTRLARHVVTLDRPYDELLVKDYAYLDGEEAQFAAQQGLMTDAAMPGAGDDYTEVPLAAAEWRYRSVFSNRDFLDTFPDTPTNRNRKRANQVFHSFLCETLAPAANTHKKDDDPHGSDPACIGCHYRLDPMARFFDHWRPPVVAGLSTYFDPTPTAAGALVWAPGQQVAGAGESDLGAILKDRPEWRQCVARRSWEFVYGAGTRLDPETLAKVTSDFEASGRKLKAAVRAAVLHPYFWSTAEPAPTNFADVSTVVKQCGCHNRQVPHLGPDTFPFDPDRAVNAQTIKRLWHAVNGHTGYKRMPPDPRPALPGEHIAILRDWIQNGARDAALAPTLTDAEIEEILND
jgi:hypothetical protein